jgi:aconitate hydratase
VLPLTFDDETVYPDVEQGDLLRLEGVRSAIRDGDALEVVNTTKGTRFLARHQLSPRQVETMLAGGIINWMRQRLDR